MELPTLTTPLFSSRDQAEDIYAQMITPAYALSTESVMSVMSCRWPLILWSFLDLCVGIQLSSISSPQRWIVQSSNQRYFLLLTSNTTICNWPQFHTGITLQVSIFFFCFEFPSSYHAPCRIAHIVVSAKTALKSAAPVLLCFLIK